MKKYLIAHPFITALLPLVSVYSYNTSIIPAIQLVCPIISVVAIAFLVLLVIRSVVKEWMLAGLMASPLLLIIFTYGRLYEYMSGSFAVYKWHSLIKVFISFAVLAAYFIYCYLLYMYRSNRKITDINIFFNALAAVLLIFNFGSMVYNHRIEPSPGAVTIKPLSADAYKPDIYYIILDQYASLAEMKDAFGYDNSAFSDWLTEKGFYIARNSKTKYVTTDMSLSSSLNLGNVSMSPDKVISVDTALVAHLDKDEPGRDNYANQMIHYDLCARILKRFGYKFINFGNWAFITRYNKLADKNIKCFGFKPDNELADMLIWDSILRLIYIPRGYFRSALLYEFDELAKMPREEGPKFVFAHILCPHLPFVFGPDGETISFRDSRRGDRTLYTGQYVFVTKKVKQLVGNILLNSKNPPIIIIQSDHGSKMNVGYVNDVFNAIYLPNGGNKMLTDTTSPQNIFRIVFNYYFGQSLPILPD